MGKNEKEKRVIELRWIEFVPKPKKDGLHESGYRFIRLVGVDEGGNRHDLGEWHDHLIVEPECNLDVTEDGVIRVMPWGGARHFTWNGEQWFSSTAWVRDDGSFR